MARISSRHNPLVTRFREVVRAGAAGDWILLDGAHLLEEALQSSTRVDIVACVDGNAQAALTARAEQAGARVVTVTARVLQSISPVRTPSGIVALARRPTCSLDDVMRSVPQLVLVINDVQDPGNVGAVVRTAEGCGATGIVTTGATADPFGWKAMRGSMGSALRVPIAVQVDLDAAIAAAQSRGVRVIATVPRDGTSLAACDLCRPAVILLGGEGPGLPRRAIESADERITIPMKPPVESLNISVAAAIVAYEAARQRS